MSAVKMNGFVSVVGIHDRRESERLQMVAKRTIPEKMNKIVLIVVGFILLAGFIVFAVKVINAPKVPVLIVDGAERVQAVRLPDGKVLKGVEVAPYIGKNLPMEYATR